jgi:hypothetical protein
MAHDLDSFAAVIELWPTAAELGRDIEVSAVLVRAWKVRGIPSEYWIDVVNSAQQRGIVGVTLELLAQLSASLGGRFSEPSTPQVRASA